MQHGDNSQAKRCFVVAVGGNALIPSGRKGSWQEQASLTRTTMDQVASLAGDGHGIVLTHGNGPVVGNIVLRCDAGQQVHGIPGMPMFVCGADSQGGIGYMIQQALQNALTAVGNSTPVASLVTQVTVRSDDPAFSNPTKPIGPFYDAEQAERMRLEHGWTVVEDSNRGWRRVVPSPLPDEVVEWEVIDAMIQAGVIVIAAGGGGVPVVRDAKGQLEGVDAVIDKDRASALLASLLKADTLVIVTAVNKVCRNYGKEDQEEFSVLDAGRAAALLAEGEFPAGSMGPKIESALEFLAGGGREVIITDPDSILSAIAGETGTRILPSDG